MSSKNVTKILFQGDSITDAGRIRNEEKPNMSLGFGYANMVTARVTSTRDDVFFYNRAIGGDRIGDTYCRWIEDMANIDFNIISLLSGVNDTGFGLRMGRGSDMERFEFIYDRMLYEVKQTHPDCEILLIQPFLFKMKDGNTNDIFNDWDIWHEQITKRGEIVKKLSDKYNTRYLPMFDLFKEAQKTFPAEHWSCDGIHPTPAGHQLIADNWLAVMEDII